MSTSIHHHSSKRFTMTDHLEASIETNDSQIISALTHFSFDSVLFYHINISYIHVDKIAKVSMINRGSMAIFRCNLSYFIFFISVHTDGPNQ
jgi:hypothetical protein